jgi:hypothetical protein
MESAAILSPVGSPTDLLEELRRRKLVLRGSELDQAVTLVSCGLPALDEICGGGWPCGAITAVQASSAGGATVLHAALAAAAGRGEVCALVDPADGLDVASAQAAGVDLSGLLWVRPRDVRGALRATELILEAGGFRLVVLDLLGSEPGRSAGVMPAAWLRLRRLLAGSGAVVLVMARSAEGGVGELAALAVKVRRRRARWRGRHPAERYLEGIDLAFELDRRRYSLDPEERRHG